MLARCFAHRRIGRCVACFEVVTLGEVGAHSGSRRRAGGVARHTRLPYVGWVVGVGSLWHPLPVGGPYGGLAPGRHPSKQGWQESQNRERSEGEEEHGGTLGHAGQVGRLSPAFPSKTLKTHGSGNSQGAPSFPRAHFSRLLSLGRGCPGGAGEGYEPKRHRRCRDAIGCDQHLAKGDTPTPRAHHLPSSAAIRRHLLPKEKGRLVGTSGVRS